MSYLGRPFGDVRQALVAAAHELYTPDRGPTLAELAAHAGVGRGAAMHTVKNLTRCGALKVARTRKVPYRNRPVGEYAPAQLPPPDAAAGPEQLVSTSEVFAVWNP